MDAMESNTRRVEDLVKWSYTISTGEALTFRRMSIKEREDFIEHELPWVVETAQRLHERLDRDSYEQYIRQLCRITDIIAVDNATRELIQSKFKNALLHRFDAFNLSTAIVEAEGAGGKSSLPQADAVDDMSDEQVHGLGENSPLTFPAGNISPSASAAVTSASGTASSTEEKSTAPTRTSRRRSSTAGSN